MLEIRSFFYLAFNVNHGFFRGCNLSFIQNQVFTLVAVVAGITLIAQSAFAAPSEIAPVTASEQINVSFVSPNPPAPGYWQHYENAMKAAAKRLNINLTVIHSKDLDRFAYLEAIEKVDVKNTDYAVVLLKINVADKLLAKFEGTPVKVITGNLEIPQQHAAEIGLPRQIFKNWIGHVIPDDYHAGQLLASKLLAEEIKVKEATNKKHPVSILAISGSRDSSVSYLRNKGLMDYIASDGTFRLEQVLYTDWKYETARQRFELLQKRFPDAKVIWSASDEIAQAVLDVLEQKSVSSDHTSSHKFNYKVGSIDWSARAISMYENPNFVTSIGGHFLEGGIILSMLRDYHDGIDFADSLGTKLLMKMGTLSEMNKHQIAGLIGDNNWHKLHFDLLSKSLGGNYQSLKADYQQVLDLIYH